MILLETDLRWIFGWLVAWFGVVEASGLLICSGWLAFARISTTPYHDRRNLQGLLHPGYLSLFRYRNLRIIWAPTRDLSLVGIQHVPLVSPLLFLRMLHLSHVISCDGCNSCMPTLPIQITSQTNHAAQRLLEIWHLADFVSIGLLVA